MPKIIKTKNIFLSLKAKNERDSPAFLLGIYCVFAGFVHFADQSLPAIILPLQAIVDLLSVRDVACLAGKHTIIAVVRIPGEETCGLNHELLAGMALRTDIFIVSEFDQISIRGEFPFKGEFRGEFRGE